LEAARTQLITTRAVLLEIANSLAKVRYRTAGVQLLTSLETDPNVEIIPLTDVLFDSAFHLHRQRHDKEWGLTDCVSFVVMHDRGLTVALTPDKHFQQAGYHALLRDDAA
jgi:predicted nucleic acid-binding protein